MMRRFGLGHAIGRVVAPNSEHAAALITYWPQPTQAASCVWTPSAPAVLASA